MSIAGSVKAQLGFEAGSAASLDELFFEEDAFLRMLALERKRTERSRRGFVLVLLESAHLLKPAKAAALGRIIPALFRSSRVTDIKGWYKSGSAIGVIYTEIGTAVGTEVAQALLAKVTSALGEVLSSAQLNDIRLSYHVFPHTDDPGSGNPVDSTLYPDILGGRDGKKAARLMKRSMDIVGGLAALIMLAPVLALTALAIKLTSRGPVLFRQERVGQYGKTFTFLKFRSMAVENDPAIHEDYVKRLIQAGSNGTGHGSDSPDPVYKLTRDPRVTPLGRFLRSTSIDELPQFFNVVRGEMSLVGPRPAIPYEVRLYDIWHKARVLSVKPGVTGVWQVEGRSRVKFDEMIRMDLRYANSWSVWTDLKLLLRTPGAVLSGNGAC